MGFRHVFHCLLVVAAWQITITKGQKNLLLNPSFEDDLKGTWKENGFNMERYTADSVDGSYSIRCFGRDRDLEGPTQVGIDFTKGKHYVFEGYVKLLNNIEGKIWQTVKAVLHMDIPNQDQLESYIIAYRGFVTAEKNWVLLKGSIEAPMKDVSNVKLSVRGPDPGVEFLVDNLTLYEVEENPNWRAEANANIEKYRKSNANITLILPKGLAKKKLTLEISLKKHLFPFGVKIEEYELVEEPMNLYTKLVYSWFNWATVQAYKWKYNKGGRYDRNFSRATNATRALLANGMKVRGHSVFWDIAKNVPEWVKMLPDNELLPELGRHVVYMMNLTKGKLQQLDVQNEHVHGHYYEERLHKPNITKDMFRLAKAEDPNGPDLYLNDFTGVTSGASTEDLYDLGVEYVKEGVPIDGIGIQGHTKVHVKPDPTAMWRRIDRLAETGLDLMMTEFDIGWPDPVQRADWLEDSIRAFFGHPKMNGVILWGFWNHSMRDPDHELVRGPNVNDLIILEPGERWVCLTKKEWTTKIKKRMKYTELSFPMRGFQGLYEVIVWDRGVPTQMETFFLGKEDTDVIIHIQKSKVPINITVEDDYVPECISHREETIIGSETSMTDQTLLTCRIEREDSDVSQDSVAVTCAEGEVMTGCLSYHLDKQWSRYGEKISMNEFNRALCSAYNAPNSTDGIRVIARCCKLAGLTCDYITAGPSSAFEGAQAEARCLEGQTALGCSVFQQYPDSQGVKPNTNITSCLAQSGDPISDDPAEREGAIAYSACCSAPEAALDCLVVNSTLSALKAKKSRVIMCPEGYTMTGCNAYAQSSKPAGARITVNKDTGETKCKAFLGADLPKGELGVQAFATCCRLAF